MQNHTKKKIKRRTFILLFLFWFCRVCLTEHKTPNARSNFSLPLLPVDLWLFFSLHYTFYFHIMHTYFFFVWVFSTFFSPLARLMYALHSLDCLLSLSRSVFFEHILCCYCFAWFCWTYQHITTAKKIKKFNFCGALLFNWLFIFAA